MSPLVQQFLAVVAQTTEQTPPPTREDPDGPLTRVIRDWTGSDLVAGLVGPASEIVLILLIAFVVSRLVRRFINHTVDETKDPTTGARLRRFRSAVRFDALEGGSRPPSLRKVQRADALGALFRSVSSFVIWGMAFFMVLGAVGINLGPLIAGAGIVGIALGFGAQDLVKDFISGVFMLLEDQYGVGDVIDAGDASGVVEGVTLRTTRVRDVQGTLWHIPNGEIRRVGNMSQDWSRALLDISVAYDTDIDRASALITQVATDMAREEEYEPKFLEDPAVWGVQNFSADSMDIRLVIKTTPGDQWGIGRELRRRIKIAFDAEGIEIPFPQRTMWIRSEGGDGASVLTGDQAKSAKKTAGKKTTGKKSTAKKSTRKSSSRTKKSSS